ncbi:MAG: hypothetical protein JNK90_12875 [Planctomycetaceae bacterium]|nr:hypothetical protein [Planctomycetaceae bacterium]
MTKIGVLRLGFVKLGKITLDCRRFFSVEIAGQTTRFSGHFPVDFCPPSALSTGSECNGNGAGNWYGDGNWYPEKK